ncbi:MAG: hypothetical protein J6K31_10450 [Parabacteroides sp.]|nr:hypothetical protein [Parabacteroides sp.]
MRRIRFLYGWLLFVCFWNVKYAEQVGAQVSAEDEFEDFLSSIEADYYNFEDSINRNFADYLEQAWQVFTVYEGTEPPVYADVISSGETKAGGWLQPDDSFFGSSLHFPSMGGEKWSLSDLSEKEVAAGWRKLGSEDFTAFFRSYMEYSRQFNLNDWGNYLLLKYASRQWNPSLSCEQTLFLFYVLSNAGYKAKIGRVEKDVLVLLLSFEEEVYKLPFIRVDGKKYYVMDFSSRQLKKLYTTVSDYPKAEKSVSLKIVSALTFPEKLVGREFTGKYSFSLSLNRNLLDFYATFPLCDLSVYFGAVPSEAFGKRVDEIVKVHLAGKSELGQIAWLLDFVQQIISHKPDMEVHGTEVYYFPEETIFYPYADCEDLSVFLAWLIYRYMASEVLVLYYPAHVAVAVERYEEYRGATFKFRNKEFLICDPSYRGAVPGKVIPACASLKPVIVSYSKQKK